MPILLPSYVPDISLHDLCAGTANWLLDNKLTKLTQREAHEKLALPLCNLAGVVDGDDVLTILSKLKTYVSNLKDSVSPKAAELDLYYESVAVSPLFGRVCSRTVAATYASLVCYLSSAVHYKAVSMGLTSIASGALESGLISRAGIQLLCVAHGCTIPNHDFQAWHGSKPKGSRATLYDVTQFGSLFSVKTTKGKKRRADTIPANNRRVAILAELMGNKLHAAIMKHASEAPVRAVNLKVDESQGIPVGDSDDEEYDRLARNACEIPVPADYADKAAEALQLASNGIAAKLKQKREELTRAKNVVINLELEIGKLTADHDSMVKTAKILRGE